MKIQLDTTAKTIRVEETVNLGELIDALKALLPDNLWKTFKLETSSVIYWSNPIVIERPVYPYVNPYYPTPLPWITYTDVNVPHIESGVYNVQY